MHINKNLFCFVYFKETLLLFELVQKPKKASTIKLWLKK